MPHHPEMNKNILGVVSCYGKFIPNLSTLVHLLNRLLQKHRPWRWRKACQRAFQAAKHSLVSNSVLAHYNPELPVKLAADDGSEYPITFASQTLTASENYLQLEKEA